MPSGAAAGVPPEERALRDAWKRHVAGARRTAAAVDAYVREASASLEAASPQEALRLFQAQWQTLPDERKWPEALRTGEYWREHAALTGHRGEAKTAVTIIDDGRRFADNQAEAWNQLGLALIVLGQLENVPNALQESVAAYRSALTAKPDRLNEPRIRINLAAALLELGAQTGAEQASLRAERLGEAKDILQSVLATPRLPLPDRARAEDNLGNVLMELGGADNTAQAFAAYERALRAGASRSHRDRILNNRGTAFLVVGNFAEAHQDFAAALAALPPDAAENTPQLWSRLKHNQAEALLGLCRQQTGPEKKHWGTEAIKAFEAARERRDRTWNAMLWGVSTVSLAGALAVMGELLCGLDTAADHIAGLVYLQRARFLSFEALPTLNLKDKSLVHGNIDVIADSISRNLTKFDKLYGLDGRGVLRTKLLAVLDDSGVSPDEQADVLATLAGERVPVRTEVAGEPVTVGYRLLQDLEKGRPADPSRKAVGETGVAAVHSAMTSPAGAPPATRKAARPLPGLPPGLTWPTETYSASPEARKGGGGIVAYLERVWLPLIEAGVSVDLRTLRTKDPTAAKGVDNYTKLGATTGERRKLPAHLDIPTIQTINDRALHQEAVSLRDAPRLVRAAYRRGYRLSKY